MLSPTLRLPSIPAVPSTSKVPSTWTLPVEAWTLNLLSPTLKSPSIPTVELNSPWPSTVRVELKSTAPSTFKVVSKSTAALPLIVPSTIVLPVAESILNLVPLDSPTLKSPSIPIVPSMSTLPAVYTLPVAAVTVNLLLPVTPTLKLPSPPIVPSTSKLFWTVKSLLNVALFSLPFKNQVSAEPEPILIWPPWLKILPNWVPSSLNRTLPLLPSKIISPEESKVNVQMLYQKLDHQH